jgi:hypothetical protein
MASTLKKETAVFQSLSEHEQDNMILHTERKESSFLFVIPCAILYAKLSLTFKTFCD